MTNTRPRWTARVLGGALALAGLGQTGCKQQLFIEPADYKEAMAAGLPPRLETHPHEPIAPSLMQAGVQPATVIDTMRPARNMTLKECIALAIEQGNLGGQGGPQNAGFANNQTIAQFGGRSVGGTDSIRALVYDPAIVGADIERSLSKFDSRWITSMTWNKQDQALLSAFQGSFQNGDQAAFSTTLAKPLPTGGVAGITFSTNYTNLSSPPAGQGFDALPTSYTPRMQVLFEQPLLQGFGVEINQLAAAHPGSQLLNLRPSGGQTTEGILITRIRYDQQRAEFDRQINTMLLNVESAYWNLYAAYYNLYAQEEIRRQSFELLSVLEKRLAAGTIAAQDLAQAEAQFFQFESQILRARQQVLDSEQQLRGLMGMSSVQATDRLVPIDEPNLAKYEPDFYLVANDTLSYRPELIQVRHDVKFRQLDLILTKNSRRPDLRFFASYDIQGIGSRLDGAPTEQVTNAQTGTQSTRPQNALDSFMDNKFNSWQLGLRLDIPLGFRDANAAVKQGQMNLYRSYWQLYDAERKALEVSLSQWRLLPFNMSLAERTRAQRIKLQRTLELNKQLIEGGTWNVNTLFNILQVQQNTAQAITNEFQAIADYNKALAGLEFTKGTIQKYNNVTVGEGALPAHVSKKAADHFKAREIGLKIRQHPAMADLGGVHDATTKFLADHPEPLPGSLPPGIVLPSAPATTNPPTMEKPTLPTPKPLPVDEKKSSFVPGEPAPTAITQWPAVLPTPLPPSIPTVPVGAALPESAPNFRAVDSVKIPVRGEK